ncbi:MAG: hypothetical protein M1279_02715 [Candidatus Marsarchaeota archaeon]|nr:hypothetical protein [Candidatus Marsarchaeota archaeon]
MATEHKEARKPRARFGLPAALLVVLVIVLAAIIAEFELSSAQVTSISSLQLSSKPDTTFSFAGSYYLAYVGSEGSSSAAIYLERQPILLNPVLEINVSSPSGTFVSPIMGNVASMELKLVSAGNGTATISISYVSPSLSIPVSSGSIRVLQHAPVIAPSNSTVSKKNASSSSTTTTVSTTTTTISNVNATKEKIMATADNSSLFNTLQDYVAAYSNMSKCTPALYNSTYISYTGAQPSGAATYYNASSITPHAMSYSIDYVNPSTYSIMFSTASDSSVTNGTAAIIYINMTSGSVSSYKLTGAFSGQTAAGLLSSYLNTTKIGGYCSIAV